MKTLIALTLFCLVASTANADSLTRVVTTTLSVVSTVDAIYNPSKEVEKEMTEDEQWMRKCMTPEMHTMEYVNNKLAVGIATFENWLYSFKTQDEEER
jgi:hypothetical protein